MRRLILGLLMLIGVVGATSYARSQPTEHIPVTENALLDRIVGELFEPGPKLEGWERMSADVLGALGSAPGGTQSNVILSVDDEDERTVTFLDSGLADLTIPKGWTIVADRPAAAAAMPAGYRRSVFAMPLSGALVVVAENPLIDKNHALCGVGLGHYRVYRVPGVAEDDLPAPLALTMVDSLARVSAGKLMCDLYEEAGSGFRIRTIHGDGQTMPKLDAQPADHARVVPRAPLDQLLFPASAD